MQFGLVGGRCLLGSPWATLYQMDRNCMIVDSVKKEPTSEHVDPSLASCLGVGHRAS